MRTDGDTPRPGSSDTSSSDQVADEEEWKSVARRKMLQFEQQLHEGDFSLG